MKKQNFVYTLGLSVLMFAAATAAAITDSGFDALAKKETLRYTIYVTGQHKAGEQITQYLPGNTVKVHYIFKDNGRGPEFDEEIKLAPDGSIANFQVKGTLMMGGPIDETFTTNGKTAEWKSLSEKGSSNEAAGKFYVPITGSMEIASQMIRVAARRGFKPIALLPSGEVRFKKAGEMTVKGGGKSQKIQLLVQTGLGLTPQYLWATTGPRARLFAFIYPGYMWAIEDVWKGNLDAMEKMQKDAEATLLKELARKLQQPMKELTVVTNARVFDSEKAELTAPMDVYIYRGRIAALKLAGSPNVSATQVIDAAGRVLAPGLFDMHAHIGRWDGVLNLAAGVTTVRDLGNKKEEIRQMLDETAAGDLIAPQIVAAGFLEGKSDFSAMSDFVIKDLAEAKVAVDWYAEHGYPQLKIYNSFPKAILRETVAYAHSRGMRVSGHVPAFMRAEEVVEQGYDEIQHINQVLLNFLVGPDTETRNLNRFVLPAEKVADLDFDSSKVKKFIKLLKDRGTTIDPTVSVFQFIIQREGGMPEMFASVAPHLPPDVQRGFRQGAMKIPDDATYQRYKKSYDKMIEFVGRMYKEGIPIVAGTDGIAGFTLQAELEYYVKAGITPAQALQIATLNGARYTRTLGDRGTVTPGKLADLVLFDGDPTKNIGDIRKVALVISRGYLMYPDALHAAVGIQPFVTNPPKIVMKKDAAK